MSAGSHTRAFVTVVTVSLDAADTIRDTLHSVISQRCSFPIEHICVDGGSKDGTRALIDEFASRNPLLIRIYEPDRGLFDAMNKGLRAATGEYVLFLNADDFLIGQDSVERALSPAWSSGGKPDMIMCDVVMGQLDRFGVWRHRKVPRWLVRMPRLGAHPPHQGNFIKRSLLLDAGGFDAEQRLAADTTQFYKLVFGFRPTLQRSGTALTFMRSGGASNAGLRSHGKGNRETYRFLRQYLPSFCSAAAVAVKLAQKVPEFRLGTLRRTNLLAE
ncbi:MAG TPA: glycosyltransferase [Nevskia sp.]|nr:glycosyltransferase [Nevskia sp.]